MTCLVWKKSFLESMKFKIIQSPKDASTLLMCVIVNGSDGTESDDSTDRVVCPFAFCNSFTSWAFVPVKPIKSFPHSRFKCVDCPNFATKFQSCKDCKRMICNNCFSQHQHQANLLIVDEFAYFGSIGGIERIDLLEDDFEILRLFDCAEKGEHLTHNRNTIFNPIDPMVHRESNKEWHSSLMPLLSSSAAA